MRREGAPLVALALALVACGDPEPIRDCATREGVQVLCGFQNPEDLATAPGGEWIIVSQFPRLVDGEVTGAGSLLALRPADGERRQLYPMSGARAEPGVAGVGSPDCSGPPDVARFAPHGIDVGPASSNEARLLVVNHGGREAIELFRLSVSSAGPAVTWQGCVPLPEDAQANDVAMLPDGAFVTTKMVPRHGGMLTMLRIALGLPTGELLLWSADEGWSRVPNTRESAPNGVAVSADGETLSFAAWGSSKLIQIGRDGGGRRELSLSHHPDNLTWDAEGHLLSTGQDGSVLKLPACGRIDSGTCPLAYSVLRIAPDLASFETLWGEDPARIGGAGTVALDHGGALWIGTFAGDRLLRVEEKP